MVVATEHKTIDGYLPLLCSLSKEARLYLVSKLTDSLLREEEQIAALTSPRRKAKVKRRTSSAVSDEELAEHFSETSMPQYPTEEPTWEEVINSNKGRTIKPIEKWL